VSSRMTVATIAKELSLELLAPGNPEAPVERGIVGDLLSHVMGNAPEKALWVTIQTHVNVAAVAVLREIPLVLLAGGREPAMDLLERCRKEGVALGVSPLSPFELCARLGRLGIVG